MFLICNNSKHLYFDLSYLTFIFIKLTSHTLFIVNINEKFASLTRGLNVPKVSQHKAK